MSQSFSSGEDIDYAIQLLKARGYVVKPVVVRDLCRKRRLRKLELKVDGARYGLHVLRNVTKSRGQRMQYVHGCVFRERLKSFEKMVVVLAVYGYPRAVLSIPVDAILAVYGNELQKNIPFNIPIERPSVSRQWLDWWSYEVVPSSAPVSVRQSAMVGAVL